MKKQICIVYEPCDEIKQGKSVITGDGSMIYVPSPSICPFSVYPYHWSFEIATSVVTENKYKLEHFLAQDVFESQSREINGQINEIKTKRIQSLSSALDLALEEFKTLQARLNEIDEPLDSFDPKLFEEVIKGMTVNNRDDMTFRLIGDLTFTVRL